MSATLTAAVLTIATVWRAVDVAASREPGACPPLLPLDPHPAANDTVGPLLRHLTAWGPNVMADVRAVAGFVAARWLPPPAR